MRKMTMRDEPAGDAQPEPPGHAGLDRNRETGKLRTRRDDAMTSAFAGRTALVTGGVSGLGRAIAGAFIGAGIRTCITGRQAEALIRAQEELDGSGRLCRTALCEVTLPDSVARLRTELADEDVSILVNNAGIAGPVAPITAISVDDWDETMAVNVRGPFLLCRAFVPAMIDAGRGDIINIASVTGKRPLARRTPYCASKMGLIGLTRSLALELGPYGIAVNTLSPGPVDSDRLKGVMAAEAKLLSITPEQAQRNFAARAAMNRLTYADEVAAAALAILSMPGVTGADIDVSAGMFAPA